MIPNKYERRYKDFVKMQDRLDEIRKILREKPLVKLKEPVQRGWEVTLRLRDDIARSDKAHIYKELISLGYEAGYITNKLDHVKRIRKGEKGYSTYEDKKRIYVDLRVGRRLLDEKKFDALPEHLQRYFILDAQHSAYLLYGRRYYWLDIPDHYMTLRVRPHMVTHMSSKGGELEREEAYLKEKVRMWWTLNTGGYSKSYPRHKDRVNTRALIRKFLKGETEDIPISKVPLEYEY